MGTTRVARLVAIAVVSGGLTVGPVPPASSFPHDQPWPGGRITYYNAAKAYSWQVKKAVEAWNRSGNVRFVRVFTSGGANVVIRTTNDLGAASGWANVGYVPGRQSQVLLASPSSRPSHVDKWVMARATAHELGHVLGFHHYSSGCSIMNFGGSNCDPPPVGKWRCRLVEKSDRRRIASLYGGPGTVRSPSTCFKWPIPKPVGELEATYRPPTDSRFDPEVALKWRNPRSKGLFRVLVNRKQGSCPTSQNDRGAAFIDEQWRDAFQNEVPRGKLDGTTDQTLTGSFGRFCYRVWTGEEAGRFGSKAPRVWVEIPDPNPEPEPEPAPFPPPNDDFAAATLVGELPYTDTVDLGSSGAEAGEPESACFAFSERNVWYRWTPDYSGGLEADTAGTVDGYTTAMAVFTGSSLDSLAELACDVESNGVYSRVTFQGTAGQPLYFLVAVGDRDPSVPVKFNLRTVP